MSETKVKKVNPMIAYFQDSYLEMKKVTWPTRNQAVRLTLLVLGFCFVAAVLIGAMDALFSYGRQNLINYAATVNPPEAVLTDYTTIPVTEAPEAAVPVGETATTPQQ